jgi:type III pantothenate kinase
MFLAINIGNSAVKFGLFEGPELAATYATPTSAESSAEQYLEHLYRWLFDEFGKIPEIKKIGISSVVPGLTDLFANLAQGYFSIEPEILSFKSQLDFEIKYDDPAQLGADRLANIAAARKIYGFPSIVIDIGTATSYDVIDERGDFIGGIIAPGPRTAAEGLFKKAARLFPVELEKPKALIATNTVDAIKAGIYYGNIGQIDFLTTRIKDITGYQDMKVIATGGFSELLGSELRQVSIIDVHLTLRGIKLICVR